MIKEYLFSLPRIIKQVIVASFDATICLFSVWGAYSLRLDEIHHPVGSQWIVYLISPILGIIIFSYFGLYRAVFRYTGISILKSLASAIATHAIFFALALILLGIVGHIPLQTHEVPISIPIISPILLLILCGGLRASFQLYLTGIFERRKSIQPKQRTLIYGTGFSALQLAMALDNSKKITLLGFIDEDPKLTGREIHGHKIFNNKKLGAIIENMGVTDIIIAMPHLTGSLKTKLLRDLRFNPIHVRILPDLDELSSGTLRIDDLQEIDISDLLGRDVVLPYPDLINKDTQNQIVMVTGAGGSIGSELCRQILNSKPSKLILFEQNEYSLYTINQQLSLVKEKSFQNTEIIPLLGSVRDPKRLEEVIKLYCPKTIYHTAAYKHVPLVEENPYEGITNNVWGTLHLAQLAIKYGVNKFVLISTDKAVRPTNVMGASKRLAELVLQALSENSRDTVLSMVRFGNVLDSSGSVVPLFRKQISEGGPVTVTASEVTRYFMTIPEAAQLVIQAGAMANRGEVYLLDMGEPVKIYDLALQMIELSGLTIKNVDNPNGDIEIKIVGLRPGEKLYEELLIGNNPQKTMHPKIMKAEENYLSLKELELELSALLAAMESNDLEITFKILKKLVYGFNPLRT